MTDLAYSSATLYLDLLESSLLGTLYNDPPLDPWSGVVRNERGELAELGKAAGVFTIGPGIYDPEKRRRGLDWPATALSMIGSMRMRNLRNLVERVILEGVPGDLIETGVWRGGACIYMRGVLRAHGRLLRKVFAADSFEGLPPPSAQYPADRGDAHKVFEALLSVSLEEVRKNFARYGLLDDQVVFLKGWFKDTLPTAPISQLALIRLDGDMYESTMDALVCLYNKLSPGGFVIVDDYNAVKGCRQAVEEFRERRGIKDTIVDIDGLGAYWQRTE